MREIIFRGKRIDNGEWVEGFYYSKRHRHRDGAFFGVVEHVISMGIIEISGAYGECSKNIEYKIIPETIGQFIGLTDANGEKIFEGDIVDCAREDEPLKVEWCEDSARFILSASTFCCDFDNYWGYEVEVIGNIYDNQELWKED